MEDILIQCPQCGEDFAIQIETALDGSLQMIEDCAVCCRPALIRLSIKSGELTGVEVEVA